MLPIIMDTTAATFAERLDQALNHVSPRQEEAFKVALTKLGKTANGPRGMVAVLADLPTPSVLADMTAGRTPGLRHRDGLARVLGISTAWLNGDDSQCPDWCLEPFEAWEQFANRLAERWQALGRSAKRSDDTSSGMVNEEPADAQRIARMMKLPLGHAAPTLLAAGRYTACDFQAVEHFASLMNLPELTHPEHLQTGQAIARIVARKVEQALATAKRRYARFMLPPRLFRVARVALAGFKAQRSHQGKTVVAVDDCLEILWRQQLLRTGATRREIPDAFTRETNRGGWMPLSRLHSRYPADEDHTMPYDSEG